MDELSKAGEIESRLSVRDRLQRVHEQLLRLQGLRGLIQLRETYQNERTAEGLVQLQQRAVIGTYRTDLTVQRRRSMRVQGHLDRSAGPSHPIRNESDVIAIAHEKTLQELSRYYAHLVEKTPEWQREYDRIFAGRLKPEMEDFEYNRAKNKRISSKSKIPLKSKGSRLKSKQKFLMKFISDKDKAEIKRRRRTNVRRG